MMLAGRGLNIVISFPIFCFGLSNGYQKWQRNILCWMTYIHFVEMNEIVYFSVWPVEEGARPMAAEKTAEINFAFYPQSKKWRGVESFR